LQAAGFPAMSTNQMPAAAMYFGDWSSLVIAEWGVLEIEVNPYAGFQAGIIGIRAMMTIDVGLRYPAAFCIQGANVT
jgi:HK97 family phage major capsid protein